MNWEQTVNIIDFLVKLETCGSRGHGLVLSRCNLPRLIHVHVVHRRALHRTSGAEGARVAGWTTRLVYHPSSDIRRQRLHLRNRIKNILWKKVGFVCQEKCSFIELKQWVPGHKAERKQASGLSSGSCVSAAPNASASPSPAPGGAEWPAASASPGTPEGQVNMLEWQWILQQHICY